MSKRERGMKKILLFIFAFLFTASSYASADDSITADKYFEPELCPCSKIKPLTGKWGGTRSDLAAKGVTFESSFVADTLGNVAGGEMQGARYNHSMGWDVNFDLEKAVGMLGTQFHPEFQARPLSPHPLFTEFLKAAIARKKKK